MCLLFTILDFLYTYKFKEPSHLFFKFKFNELSKNKLCLLFDQNFKRPRTLLKLLRLIKFWNTIINF